MREGVAEIEQHAALGLALVGRHDRRLRGAAGDDRVLLRRSIARQQRGAVALEPGEEIRLVDQSVLHDLGIAGAQLARRQRGQHVGVGQHQPGLMEGADQVLAVPRVDAGLAADRAVDLGEQAGRDLHVRDAAQQDRRAEPGEVADHAAAEGDDRGRALDPGLEQEIQQGLELRHALAGFAGRQDDPAMAKRRSIEARLEPRQMRGRGEILVGHDDQIARALHRQLLAGARQQAPADQDVVAAVRRDRPARGWRPSRCPLSCRRQRLERPRHHRRRSALCRCRRRDRPGRRSAPAARAAPPASRADRRPRAGAGRHAARCA